MPGKAGVKTVRSISDAGRRSGAGTPGTGVKYQQGILREFLLRNKAEVKHVNIYEYNEEASNK